MQDTQRLNRAHSLLQKLAHDLRLTLAPSYSELLSCLLRFLHRSLPAPALTALLATLSTIFKFLLVPSDKNLLEKTWSAMRTALAGCNLEVQRAVAEVWGSLLRRLKPAASETAVRLMMEDLTNVEDACAWAFVFACKVGHFLCVIYTPGLNDIL